MEPIEVEGGGLFTDKQMDYVNSVKDNDLRPTLLHQIRLRDILRDERDELERAYDDLVLKFKRQQGNGLQLEDWDKLKKGDIVVLNHDNGNFVCGDKFKFMWCDGITIVIKSIKMVGTEFEDENNLYLDRSSIIFFHTEQQWG